MWSIYNAVTYFRSRMSKFLKKLNHEAAQRYTIETSALFAIGGAVAKVDLLPDPAGKTLGILMYGLACAPFFVSVSWWLSRR